VSLLRGNSQPSGASAKRFAEAFPLAVLGAEYGMFCIRSLEFLLPLPVHGRKKKKVRQNNTGPFSYYQTQTQQP
jgi:hypothetical protein